MHPETKLFFLRHGEAHPTPPSCLDIDRPLTKQGMAQAKKQGEHLHETPFDLLVTSHAVRAKETAFRVLGPRHLQIPQIIIEMLYIPVESPKLPEETLLEKLSPAARKRFHSMPSSAPIYPRIASSCLLEEVQLHERQKEERQERNGSSAIPLSILVVAHANILIDLPPLLIEGGFVDTSSSLFHSPLSPCTGFVLYGSGEVSPLPLY